ncbi:HAD family hydrolase [Bartonella tamiae]|uniref:HAD hydrolase, family IA n=1 Tax=Bartonella tamiae Th239 TaxID=1094558 RepID=J0ZPM7_9HYPH|nr:HAD family hydrolase [Bartonella tamiae]EJF90543.1 HAD hydrolase, family IA [Bartonella tamiae Th239]EJF94079.1 HAD hydrolase, family IA [Bartonella tamiae Th307]
MTEIDLIIFDCDGVLVDSEYLAAQVNSQLLTEVGHPISPEELSSQYAGLVFVDILKEIERETNTPIPASIIDRVADVFRQRMETELQSIDDVRDAVTAISKNYPYCICSNSTKANIERMLTLVGLYDLFEGKIFSASEVGTKKVKPAPDVYLFAAQTMKARPRNTIVIEDSIHGVHGATAAGMRVIGFTGGSHAYSGLADALTEAGAQTVISRHKDLPAVIHAMAEWNDI